MNTIFENSAPLTALVLFAISFLLYYAIYRYYNRDKKLALTPFGHEVDRSKAHRLKEPMYAIKAVVEVDDDTCKSLFGDTIYEKGQLCQEKAMYMLWGHTVFPGYHSWWDFNIATEHLKTPPYTTKKAVPAIFKIPEHAVVCVKKEGRYEMIISSNIIFIDYV